MFAPRFNRFFIFRHFSKILNRKTTATSLKYALAIGTFSCGTVSICLALPFEKPQKLSPQYLGRYTISDAADKCAPSVVNITSGNPNQDMIPSNKSIPYGKIGGSGFIITKDGLIVTNAHVAVAHGPLYVTLANGDKHLARLQSMDQKSDIALLKIDVPYSLTPAKLGTSSSLRAGEYVIALGSPLFLQNSLTLGIVSAVARPGSDLGLIQRGDFIQTDAAINMGNSGGPLISLDGEVIGINTFKAMHSDGIGFAIPIDVAKLVIDQLQKFGKVARPYIGLRMVNVSLEYQGMLVPTTENDVGNVANSGVMVIGVTPNSPADIAGLQSKDIILTFGSKPARSTADIHNGISLKIGQEIAVSVLRSGCKDLIEMTIKTAAERADMRN